MNKTLIVTVAIVAVSALEAYALHLGHNGTLLASAFALIGGLAGFSGGYAIGLYKPIPQDEEKDGEK